MELPHKRTILFALSGDVHANASLERCGERGVGTRCGTRGAARAPAGRGQSRRSHFRPRRDQYPARALGNSVRTRTLPAAGSEEIDAELVVLAPLGTRSGKCVTELARRARRPVLVAREAARESSIPVATDLSAACASDPKSSAAHVVNRAARSVVVTPVLPSPAA